MKEGFLLALAFFVVGGLGAIFVSIVIQAIEDGDNFRALVFSAFSCGMVYVITFKLVPLATEILR